MKTKLFKKKDIWFILGLLAVALIIWGILSFVNRSGSNVLYAKIYYYKTVVKTVPLDKDQVFSVPEEPQVIFEVKDNAVAFVHSDCPDKICVNSGWLSKNGDFAACLPNQLSVWIEDKK